MRARDCGAACAAAAGRLAQAALLAALLASGCATTELERVRLASGTLPARAALEGVPFHPQEAFQCGPAALASALGWSGLARTPEQLVPQVYTPGLQGSLEASLVAAGRRHGRLVYRVSRARELVTEIAAGHPVVVLQNLGLSWFPVWHWAIAIGYDFDGDHVELHSGRRARHRQSLALFDRTWARSGRVGLVLLAPGELPASAREAPLLEAVAALAAAGQPAAAARTYRAALERWPESYAAAIGLGSSLRASGDLPGAERAFRAAAAAHPQQPDALERLAEVLLERGERAAARAAAERARGLREAGPRAPNRDGTD